MNSVIALNMGDKNPYKTGGMFEGALHTVFANAKNLRNNMTAAENVLWHLKQGINGCKFRRQHPIGLFIADFYCHKAKLVIEIDGSIHNIEEVKQNDISKEHYFTNAGYSILRFTNAEVLSQSEIILQKITTAITINICKQSPNIGG